MACCGSRARPAAAPLLAWRQQRRQGFAELITDNQSMELGILTAYICEEIPRDPPRSGALSV